MKDETFKIEKDFPSIGQMFNFIEKLEKEEPYTKEQLQKDLELAQQGDRYDVKARIRGRGTLTFEVPDLNRVFGKMKVECGIAIVEGFGRAKINFKQSFSETPGLVESKFGFVVLRVPWVVIEWRYYRLGWWRIRLPVPRLAWMHIRLPTMCFVMGLDKKGFEVFNVFGRTYIAYMAIGK